MRERGAERPRLLGLQLRAELPQPAAPARDGPSAGSRAAGRRHPSPPSQRARASRRDSRHCRTRRAGAPASSVTIAGLPSRSPAGGAAQGTVGVSSTSTPSSDRSTSARSLASRSAQGTEQQRLRQPAQTSGERRHRLGELRLIGNGQDPPPRIQEADRDFVDVFPTQQAGWAPPSAPAAPAGSP